MTESIVCATRGGEGSRAVQEAAIERATSTKRPLLFLYVVAMDDEETYDEPLHSAVIAELSWMGQALLHIAQERALEAGINASVHIRTGDLREEIVRFLEESNATLLLLGAPRNATAYAFGDDAIEQFSAEVQASSGVEVEIVQA